MFPPRATSFGEVRLDVDGLEAPGLVEPVSLAVRQGEILGLAGQIGSGAPTLLRAVGGIALTATGTVRVDGEEVPSHSLQRAIAPRHRLLLGRPQARRRLPDQDRGPEPDGAGARPGQPGRHHLAARKERALARQLASSFAIDQSRLGFYARTLSGGNQQKVALAKWLGVEPKVLLVEEPTRGVDVGARAEIYSHLRRLASDGMAVVFASSDLPEVLGLADTVATFYRGRLVRVAPAADLSQAEMMRDVTHERRAGRRRRPRLGARVSDRASARRPFSSERAAHERRDHDPLEGMLAGSTGASSSARPSSAAPSCCC